MNSKQYLVLVFVIALALLISVQARGVSSARQSRDLIHVAGGAATYALSYTLWRLMINDPKHKWVCHVFSAFVTTVVAASWELQHVGNPRGQNQPSGRDFGYGMLGGGAVMGATLLFNF